MAGLRCKGGGEGYLALEATQHRQEPEISVPPELDLIDFKLRNISLPLFSFLSFSR